METRFYSVAYHGGYDIFTAATALQRKGHGDVQSIMGHLLRHGYWEHRHEGEMQAKAELINAGPDRKGVRIYIY